MKSLSSHMEEFDRAVKKREYFREEKGTELCIVLIRKGTYNNEQVAIIGANHFPGLTRQLREMIDRKYTQWMAELRTEIEKDMAAALDELDTKQKGEVK